MLSVPVCVLFRVLVILWNHTSISFSPTIRTVWSWEDVSNAQHHNTFQVSLKEVWKVKVLPFSLSWPLSIECGCEAHGTRQQTPLRTDSSNALDGKSVCVCCLVPGIRHHSVPSRIIVIMAWMAVWENSRKSVTLPPCIDSSLSPSVSKNLPQEGFSNKKWYLVSSKTPKRSKCLIYEGKSLCFWDGKSVFVCVLACVCVC